MDLDRLFCSLQFVGDLLVEHPESEQRRKSKDQIIIPL
jgi:hypothetical protein